jgi:DNA replication protein DnaC
VRSLNIDTCDDDPRVLALAEGCLKWLEGVRAGERPRWLSLLGLTGTGKTHCARRLYRMTGAASPPYHSTDFFPSFVHWPSMVDDLRSFERQEEYRDMRRWPFLFLDDIMAERDTTGFASEKLSTLLSTRAGRWTVLTSNLTLDQIARSDTRIADRMLRDGGVVVDVTAPSYALRKRGLA